MFYEVNLALKVLNFTVYFSELYFLKIKYLLFKNVFEMFTSLTLIGKKY